VESKAETEIQPKIEPSQINLVADSKNNSINELPKKGQNNYFVELGDPEIGIWEKKYNLGTIGAFVDIGLNRYKSIYIVSKLNYS